jgi:hypothetical protein
VRFAKLLSVDLIKSKRQKFQVVMSTCSLSQALCKKGDTIMKKLTFGILAIIYLNSIASADNVKLYKHYTFGMSKDKIKKEANVYDCSKDFEQGALCKDKQSFVGENIDLGFRFINNKLVTVVLFTEFTNENYIKFIGALNSKFQLLTMESNQKKIDFLVQMKKYKRGVFLKNITDFEQNGLSNGNIKYSFIDKNVFLKLGKSSSNITDLVMKASEDIRAVEYIITEDGNNAYGLIQFSAPKKSLALLKKKQKYEDF